MSKAERGFANMDPIKQRSIASKGGKAAHAKGTAHQWTTEEARKAGKLGGQAAHRRRDVGRNSQNDNV
jgi:hypothetical protein